MADYFLYLYFALLGGLSIHGLHILWLIYHRLKYPPIPDPAAADPLDPDLPRVTLQLPVFNEKHVVKRLIDVTCGMEYPKEKLEIQVLDDSTDETSEISERLCRSYRDMGWNIRWIHRDDRTDYKAGALANALPSAQGEFIAIFDADFVPPADFLLKVVPCFDDPKIGMTQVRWSHLNEESSMLTRLQALFLDGHFVMESETRDRASLFLTFNGTAGVWRKQCIEDAGGWEGDTLTEDLDLSYRAQLNGWKFRFLRKVSAPAELPERVEAFKSQQARWTRGAVETLRKLGSDLFLGNLPIRIKVEAFFHLTSHLVFPALVLLSLCAYPALTLRLEGSWIKLLVIDLPLYILGVFSINLFYIWGQISLYPDRLSKILRIPGLLFLGTGLAVSNTLAVIEGYFGKGQPVFERTPKNGGTGSTHYRSIPSRSTWIELALSAYLIVCIISAAREGLWASIPFLAVFALGFGGLGWWSLVERCPSGSSLRCWFPFVFSSEESQT